VIADQERRAIGGDVLEASDLASKVTREERLEQGKRSPDVVGIPLLELVVGPAAVAAVISNAAPTGPGRWSSTR
jgi:hypothetical protein